MSDEKQVKVSSIKGRPMLTWVGKRPLSYVTAFPAQHIETFDPTEDALRQASERDLWSDWPDRFPRAGLLFLGDNKEVLAYLLANGFRNKVKLIYIDPPFDSGADYIRRVRLRGSSGTTQIDGESYNLGEQIQYEDIWANDTYLQFMYERLILLKELLIETGILVLHCDYRKSHHLRCLLDEIFGAGNLVNEIIWQNCNTKNDPNPRKFSLVHNYLLIYSNGTGYDFEMVFQEYSENYLRRAYRYQDERGRYRLLPLHANSGTERDLVRLFNGKPLSPPLGKFWRWSQEAIDEGFQSGAIVMDEGGVPQYKKYLDLERGGVRISSLWTDAKQLPNSEDTDYPTQKPEIIVERLIQAFTKKDDLVLDSFIGSGTTAAVAQKLGRRWIGCDINKGAIQETANRLLKIVHNQILIINKINKDNSVNADDKKPEPAQLSFTVWRVNNYDLQIQHNEAVNLVCEKIGIQRTRTDMFFEGTLGRNLVKIVPFNHPLSPLDLEEIRNELEARPDEDRNITVVCLGKELAADAWIDAWNRLRLGQNSINRVDVIELRTDPRYGGFMEHKPTLAKVVIARQDGQIHIEIEDFISPTIIERLSQQSGVLRPQVEDFRAMINTVMIDLAYNGKVFNVAISDVPEKKNDLVLGTYTLPAPDSPTTVAVKITDMLGEELLVMDQL